MVCGDGLAFSVLEKHKHHVKAGCSSRWCVLLEAVLKMPMEQTELTWQLLLLKKTAVEEKMQVEGKSLKGAALRHICDSRFLTFPCQMYPGSE